jgi:RNA polymerase sigma-70 factor (ECF subfamily)
LFTLFGGLAHLRPTALSPSIPGVESRVEVPLISRITPDSTLSLSPLAPGRSIESLEQAALQQEVLVLFDRFRDPLLRYVCACGVGVGDGEDIVQDVFLVLFRHLQRNGSRSNLQGWLFRVAHNLALKRRARQQREVAQLCCDAHAGPIAVDAALDPERRLVDDERRLLLRRVLDALPERERQCLHLRHDGLRYREIAKVMGISLGAVAKLSARAIARLVRADER